jgi:hypothetical protein
MERIKAESLATPGTPPWPNVFVFPKELRDAIPEHSARALAFDSASGGPAPGLPLGLSGMAGPVSFEVDPRTRTVSCA